MSNTMIIAIYFISLFILLFGIIKPRPFNRCWVEGRGGSKSE